MSEHSERTIGHSNALSSAYDAILLDLDGTVYRGSSALPGAPEAVTRLRRDGTALVFVTNNASRSPEEVAKHLTGLGVVAATPEVATSGQAAAVVLADRLAPSARVLVVGTEALADEITTAGLAPVRSASDDPAAVVQGHSPDTGWRELAEACVAIRGGRLWVACNVDPTLPTEHGELPGNGAMVAALRAATGRDPVVAGKPARPLVDASVAKAGARRALMVGDRLDTDVAGAVAAGLDSLLVLSGSTDAAMLLAAPADRRPTYLAADLGGLAMGDAEVRIGDRGGWTCEMTDGELVLQSRAGGDPVDALRALCARWWADGEGAVRVIGSGSEAEQAVRALGLDATG